MDLFQLKNLQFLFQFWNVINYKTKSSFTNLTTPESPMSTRSIITVSPGCIKSNVTGQSLVQSRMCKTSQWKCMFSRFIVHSTHQIKVRQKCSGHVGLGEMIFIYRISSLHCMSIYIPFLLDYPWSLKVFCDINWSQKKNNVLIKTNYIL